MTPSLRSSLLLIGTLVALCQLMKPSNAIKANNADCLVKNRIQRGALSLLRALLSSASRAASLKSEKAYYKFGGYKQASKDFTALNPTDVRKTRNRKHGYVGTFQVDLLRQKPPVRAKLKIYSLRRNTDGTLRLMTRVIVYWD